MLTIKQIDAAKPKERPYRIADGNGLFLFIPVSGKKVWQVRYHFDGKEKLHTIGKYPEVGAAEARDLAFELRRDIATGVNPSLKKKMKSQEPDSFLTIFNEWFAHKSVVWSKGYADELKRMFDDDVLPLIGNMRMEEIEPMVLLKVIRLYEERGAMDRADKARRRCGEVFRYAIVTGRAKYNPAPDLVDALKGYRKQNFPFLPMNRIREFHHALDSYGGSVIAKYAAITLHYTALRTKELRSMAWENVDFENRLITITADVMKSRKVHIVPMSSQVINLLSLLKKITGQYALCFPGRTDQKKPISENTVLGVIRRVGYEGQTSGHGFRHQFSTVMNEMHWNSDAIEAQLAHVSSHGTRGIYNHAQYLDSRIEMMQAWADWLNSANG